MLIPHKAKQFLTAAAKLLIVATAVYFIGERLSHAALPDWKAFFHDNFITSITLLFFIVLLGVLNRLLEIIKWKKLVATLLPISLSEATKQVMAGMTAGIITPSGVGEYAGKALFFEKTLRKKIVFLNFVCNGAQMLLTTVLGLSGLLYFNAEYHIITPQIAFGLGLSFLAVLAVLLFLKRVTIRGYSIEKLVRKINEIPKIAHRENLLLALARYTAFSHQQYLLLLLFGVKDDYLVLMSAITAVYLLASCLPTFQLFDVTVKGGIAVWCFAYAGVDQWAVLFATTSLWLLNVVIPVLIGCYYILWFRAK